MKKLISKLFTIGNRRGTTNHFCLLILIGKANHGWHGLRMALFVSSTYHMRRIKKIITGKIFKGSSTVKFVPNRYETTEDTVWLFNNRERRLVMTEYGKLVWFLLASSFPAQPI